MKKIFRIALILSLVLCFVIPAFAVKILPYNVPLQDLMSWDKNGAKLRISNPEGENITVSWASTVDLWNYDGSTWTYNLPDGDTFAFSKSVGLNQGLTVPDDKKITFGSDSDATIEYDEDGTNKLILTCSNGFTISGAVTMDSVLTASITNASATPGTIRAVYGKQIVNATMTSGNLVGVRGEIDMDTNDAAVSGSYLYGVQGKLITGAGSIDGTNNCAVMGQVDVTNGTLTSGHISALSANVYGANSGSFAMEGIYIEHAGGGVINSFIQMFGKTDYVFDISSNVHTNVSTTGTPGAVTGGTGWIKILVDGAVRYIPLTDSVS